MMLLLMLAFASDVADLGHYDFRRREAATRRLERAGWYAMPAINAAMADLDPERAMRGELLWKRLMGRWERERYELPVPRQMPAGDG